MICHPHSHSSPHLALPSFACLAPGSLRPQLRGPVCYRDFALLDLLAQPLVHFACRCPRCWPPLQCVHVRCCQVFLPAFLYPLPRSFLPWLLLSSSRAHDRLGRFLVRRYFFVFLWLVFCRILPAFFLSRFSSGLLLLVRLRRLCRLLHLPVQCAAYFSGATLLPAGR